MPFIENRNRVHIAKLGISACENVGDICFVFYDHLIKAWNLEPRWRTAHRLFDFEIDPIENEFFQMVYEKLQDKFSLVDVTKASALAYKVFFDLKVMPYELKKLEENGDI